MVAVEDEAVEPDVKRAHIAVPEHSQPGESQSNGLAERAIREVVEEIRTLKMSLERRVKGRLANTHPVMAWMASMRPTCSIGASWTLTVALHTAGSMAKSRRLAYVNPVDKSYGLFRKIIEPSWMRGGAMGFSFDEHPTVINMMLV